MAQNTFDSSGLVLRDTNGNITFFIDASTGKIEVGTSTFALDASTANVSNFATFALDASTANVSNFALDASTANYASVAQNAISADYAGNANIQNSNPYGDVLISNGNNGIQFFDFNLIPSPGGNQVYTSFSSNINGWAPIPTRPYNLYREFTTIDDFHLNDGQIKNYLYTTVTTFNQIDQEYYFVTASFNQFSTSFLANYTMVTINKWEIDSSGHMQIVYQLGTGSSGGTGSDFTLYVNFLILVNENKFNVVSGTNVQI